MTPVEETQMVTVEIEVEVTCRYDDQFGTTHRASCQTICPPDVERWAEARATEQVRRKP